MVTAAISGLLPHPPVAIPEIGRDLAGACSRTSEACRAFARRLVALRPERVFLVSPHAPRLPAEFGFWSTPRLRGDLARFGAAQVAVDLPADPALVEELVRCAGDHGAAIDELPPDTVDHGTVVPAWFLQDAGWSGPTTAVSLPQRPGREELIAFGQAVRSALAAVPGRAALIASGDLSHRATPEAPYGYDPRGLEFDRTLARLVRDGQLDRIPAIDGSLRAGAGEDAVDSSTVITAALDFEARGAEVLSYEHPFGIGYLVAVFHDGGESQP